MSKFYATVKLVCTFLFVFFSAWGIGRAYGTMAKPPGQPRYLSLGIMNVENGDVYLPIMERAAAAGVNSFLLNVNWDHIYSQRGAAPAWDQLDKQVALAESLGCKVMLRIWVARHDDATWWPDATRPLSSDGLRSSLLGGFSYNDPNAIAEANGFIREVAEHFRPKQQAGLIVVVAVATTKTAEIGYHYDAYSPASNQDILQVYDYSFFAKKDFRKWVEEKYGNLTSLNKAWNSDFSSFSDISPPFVPKDPWSSFYGKIGEDWYLFRHRTLKDLMDGFVRSVKEVDPSYRFVHDMGSCYDGLSAIRGTLGFKDLCASADGLKVNDDHTYPHRFATDLLRSNFPGKFVGHELGNAGGSTVGDWRSYIDEAFEHGADWVNMFAFDRPFNFPAGEGLIRETAAKWLQFPVPDIQPTQTVSYTLSEALRLGTGRIQGQWRNEYTKTYQPIRVILVEDLLSERTGENKPPVVDIPLTDQGAKVGKDFQYYIPEATFSDPDGYISGIVVDGLPAGIGISGWAITGKPLQSGVFTVTITARDNRGAQVAAQFKLTVLEGDANQPPVVARSIPDQSGTVGVAFAYEVARETFTDADGTVAGIGFSGLPGGISATGWRVSGVPTSAGVYTVTVTATDNAGASVSTTFKLAVASAGGGDNQPPVVARSIPDQTGRVGVAFAYEVDGGTFTDPDGTVAGVSFAGLPAGVTATGWRVSGVPTSAGVFTVTVTATDNAGAKVSTAMKLTVQAADAGGNQYPEVRRTIPDQTATVGAAFSYEISKETFVDPDGPIIDIAVAGLPGGVTQTDWRVSGVPTVAGVYTVTVTARDNRDLKVSTTFKLTVQSAGGGGNQPPVVARSIPDQSGTVGVAFAYEVAKETFTDADGTVAGIGFSGLPGGISATGWRVSGVPTAAGVYTVTVTATDNAGASVSTTFKLAVASAGGGDNQPPVVARSIPDQTGRVGVAFAYEVSKETFTDPDGTVAGVSFAGLPAGVTATGWRVSGVPTSAGVFTVTVTATDNAGAKVSTAMKLTVQAADAGGNQYPEVRRTIPDQTATVGAAFSYEISKETFVDPDGPIIDIAVAGLPGGVTQTDWRVSGVPTVAGVYTVTVTARDNRDLKVSTTFKLTVQSAGGGGNQPPVVARSIPDQSGTVGVAFAYEVAKETFTDADGTVAGIGFSGLPGGISATGWRVSGVPTAAGVYTVTVTATDNAGASVSTTFKLAVASAGGGDNQPPVVARSIPDQTGRVGVAFAYEVSKETFTDPDGTVAGVSFAGLPAGVTATGWRVSGVPTSAGVFTVTVTATDNAGAKVSTAMKLTVQAADAGGNQYPEVRRTIPDQTATVGAAFSYEISKETFVDPDGPIIDIAVAGLPGGVTQTDWRVSGVPTVAGVYTVTVTARDNRDLKVSTTFKLTVQSAGGGGNQPPVVARSIPDQSGTVGVAFAYEVAKETFTDADGTVAGIGFSGLPGGISATGWRVSGVPTAAGVYTVTVTATDNAGASVSTTFKLAVASAGGGDNQPPVVARSIPDQTGHVDVAFAYEVSKETFTDPDGTVAGVSFAGLPAGVTATGWRVSGVPTASGVYTVTVTATDNAGAKVSTTMKMTILPGGGGNKAPVVAKSIPDQSGTIGAAFAYEVSKETFTDPDGSIAGISFAGLPGGVTASGWRVSGAPTSVGIYTVTVTATDNVGAQVSTSFKLTILSAANQPPVVVRSIPDQSGTIGAAFAYEVSKETFTDAEGPIASISFAGLPAGVTASSWRLSGVPTAAGVFTVTVTASDGEGAKVSTSFKLTIQAVQQDNIISLFKAGNFLTRRFVRDILEGDTLRGEEVSQTVNLMVSPRTGTIGSYSFNLAGPISTTSEDSSTPYGVFGDNGGVILTEGKYTLTVKSYTEAGLQGTLMSQQVLHFVVMEGQGQKNLPPVLAKPPGTLFAKVGKPYAYRLPDSTFVDPDGFLTSFTIASLPDGLVGDGTLISGTPTKKGEYTANVRVIDNGGATAETTFRFVVSADNLPPVVNGSVPDQVAEVNKPFNYTLPENIFQDPDGTIVSVAFIGLPEGITSRGLTLSGVPVKVRENPIIVIATDNGDAMVQLTFNINVIENNRPPVVAKPIGDQLTESSTDYRFVIPAGTFTDPDGSIVRYEMSGLPPGLTARGDTLSGRPTQAGEYMLTVKAFDNKQASVQLTFKLIVLGNRPPLVNRPIANQVTDSSTVYRFVVPAGTFVDPDGSIVRLEISGLPSGITARGDTISGRAAQMGEFTVSVRAYDNNGASVQLTFKLSVLGNRPPLVAKPMSDQEVDINVLYRFVIPGGTFVDLDGRIIRVEFSGLPPGITAQGDTISGRPSRAGQYTVSVRAYDDKGAAVQTTFKITIKDSTIRPTVEPIPDVVAIVGQVFTFDVKSYFKDEQGSLTSINYASTLPPGITASGSKLSGNPFTEGKYTIKVAAKDNKGGTLETTFILKVEKPELRVLLYQMQQGTRKLIRPVANVDRMALDTLPPALNLFVESNASITSVTFIITSPMVQYTTDESAPFGLFGDSGSFPAQAGTYTLNVLGYRSTTLVASRSIQFTITKTTNSPGRLGVVETEVLSETELWKPYPSPFVDRVKVQTTPQGNTKLHAVEVLSSEGKLMSLPATNWTVDQSLLEVDLSETVTLPGVYLLRVTGEDGKQKTMRILKAAPN